MLSHYRVLDLSDERGLLCGHLLSQLGADVIHVEAPGPTVPNLVPNPVPDRSPTWLAYAAGSRSVELDLDAAADRQRFFELVAGADALIESADPGSWEARGLGYDELSTANPALVWVSITPFGSHGPKAGYAATDLIVQAAAGTVDITGPIDRPPLRTAGITAWAHAGAEAAGGALIALAEARRSGRGQRVEVSAQRAKNLAAFFTVQNERIGNKRLKRNGSGFQVCGVTFPFVWPAADGFVSVTVAIDPGNKPFLDRLLAYMAEEDEIDPDLLAMNWITHARAVRSGDLANTDLQRLSDAIGAFLAKRTKGDLLAAALDRRLLLVPVATIAELLDSPQLDEREFWRDGTTPDGRAVRLPAHLVRGTPAMGSAPTPAPRPGQHTAEVLSEPARPAALGAAGAHRAGVEAHRAGVEAHRAGVGAAPSALAPSNAPLAGLKILDMMWVMAGPTSTGVLAQYGATVIRVENPARIDTVRLLAPFFDGKPGRERSLPFASINAAKLSVTLDPNIAEAREVLADLVRWADIVTESFSPKAMKGWGLDYESLRKIKPDLIMLSSCLFGQNGPYSGMAGYGTMGAAIGGMVQPTGWPDQSPAGPYGAYTDVCAPRISTAVLLAAVEHRNLTGEGLYLDQSQIESSLHYMTPALVDHQLNGTSWDRLGNDDPDLFPHAIFPALGDNEWTAVAVRDQRDWRALAEILGRPEWASAPEFATVLSRRARRTEIDAAIEAWTSKRSPRDGERELQAVGVPAHGVVHSDGPPDEQLAHLHHVVEVPHLGNPDRPVERTRIELTRTPPEPSHVPAMGEHTDQVLTQILDYSPDRIAALRAVGALGSEPKR